MKKYLSVLFMLFAVIALAACTQVTNSADEQTTAKDNGTTEQVVKLSFNEWLGSLSGYSVTNAEDALVNTIKSVDVSSVNPKEMLTKNVAYASFEAENYAESEDWQKSKLF